MQLQTEKTITRKALSPKEVVTRLRQKASEDPIFKSVAQGFAIRERSRNQVTIASLTQKMNKEGFNYTRQDYVDVLKFLANLGFGRLDLSPKGKVRALKDIPMTLQSIGMAAVANSTDFDRQSISKAQAKLPIPKVDERVAKAHAKTIAGKIGMNQVKKSYKAQLIVHFAKDEVTTFELPNGITEQQLGSFLARYYNSNV